MRHNGSSPLPHSDRLTTLHSSITTLHFPHHNLTCMISLLSVLSVVLSWLTCSQNARAATTDSTCVRSCSEYSIVLGHCRIIYGDHRSSTLASTVDLELTSLAYTANLTYANDFVSCVCTGQENDQVIGDDALQAAAGICQACDTTPDRIKEDLSVSHTSGTIDRTSADGRCCWTCA
jgi:hypothetical protein